METADQADTPTHLGTTSFPLQHGVPEDLAVDCGTLGKPETPQVHLLTCKIAAITRLLRCLSPSGVYASICMDETECEVCMSATHAIL